MIIYEGTNTLVSGVFLKYFSIHIGIYEGVMKKQKW